MPGQLIRRLILRKNPSGKIVKSVNVSREMVMYRLGTILFILPIVYGLTPWLDFAHFPLPYWVRGVGFRVSVLGMIVLLLSQRDLGKNWTGQLNIQQHQELVVRGIYTYVRHPMYLSFLLSGMGTLLLSANWLIGVPLIVWFWVMYLGRAKHEEQMMLKAYSEKYQAYTLSTGRLLPK